MAWIWNALAAALAFVTLKAVIKFSGSLPPRVSHFEGNMAWILNALNILHVYFGSLEPLPLPSLDHVSLPTQLNDYVYEVCKPHGRPSIEVVFFHGLQIHGALETHLTTWLSSSPLSKELWPRWIAERFPEARILLVSYDGFVRKNDDQGRTDMHITGENLVQSLTEEAVQVGRDGCPLVLVGHCIGGLVIKELLLQANAMLSLDQQDKCNEHVQCLLESVKELFYYATPHHGLRFADIRKDFLKGLLVKRITVLNKEAARCNETFRKLRQKYGWNAIGIAENLPVTLGKVETKLLIPDETSETQLVVEEASTRCDVDILYTVQANHFDVCRPKSKTDSAYSQLINVIDRALIEDVPGHKMRISDKVVGLVDEVEIVKEALKKARRLGIVGTGGMGKSTLAKAVYNSISGDFEYTCFLSNVKNSINKEDSMEVLEERIARSLYYKGRRKQVKWNRLTGKKILFILDDVEDASQVYTGLDGFSNESCILVTSRDRRFVRSMDFEIHDAKLLDDEASNRLFCHHAFKGADPPDDYKTRVALFLKKCGGLPLALEVTGKYLSTQSIGRVWDDAYKKLSQAKPLDGRKDDELWSIFKVIYESLAEDEKEMFLDIATCFHGEELESVKPAWRACSWAQSSADAGWQNLLDKGLVTLTTFHQGTWINGMWTEDGCIQMHEVLRDLGRSIACTSCKIDQKCTRVCIDGFNPSTWPFTQGKPNFEVKLLKIGFADRGHDKLPKIDIETLSGLEKLEILWLDGVTLSGAWNLFPVNLEFLRLRQCDWDNKEHVERSSERIAVEGSSSRREDSSRQLGEHPTLRHFEIERLVDLQPLLITLGLDNRGQLQALENLNFERDPDQLPRVEAFPDTFEQLRHIRIDDYMITISHCSGVTARSRHPRKHLSISGCWLPAVPVTLRELPYLEHLLISRCPVLVSLPNTLGYLRSLRQFVISSCTRLDSLPESCGMLSSLEHLEISYCDSLNTLPESLGQLDGLRHFVISNCPRLNSLPYTVGELKALQRLEISYCDGLETLPESLGKLTTLQRLQISYCDELAALPESLGELSALEHLEISSCAQLEARLESFGPLDDKPFAVSINHLRLLSLSLRGLRHLLISKCPHLDRFPDTLRNLPALEHLEISDCDTLEALPDTIGPLRALRHLEISKCPDLCRLPCNLGELPALEHLEISYCDMLRTLPHTIGRLPRLRYFVIKNCPRLDGLPDIQGELIALEHLDVSYCDRLQGLPNSLRDLIGRNPCNLCGNSGHWDNDCPLKQLESQLQQHQLTVANLSRNKPQANLTELEDPPEDSDDDSDEVEDPPDDSDDGGDEQDGNEPEKVAEFE